jgi:hypothetical protein
MIVEPLEKSCVAFCDVLARALSSCFFYQNLQLSTKCMLFIVRCLFGIRLFLDELQRGKPEIQAEEISRDATSPVEALQREPQ